MPANDGMTTPLSTQNLAGLGDRAASDGALLSIAVPEYDPATLRRSIIHIGVGGFHRAHLASYIDELCRRGNTDWSIVGAGVLEGDAAIASALEGQDYLYSLSVKGPAETTVRVIASIVDFHHAHPDPKALIEQIASPDTQMVTLTITEGGYPVDDATGRFDPDSPLAGSSSAFGILARALQLRQSRNVGPLTVVSCDNIVSNGKFTKTATIGEADRIDPSLAAWVDAEIAFPNSMVDRITPATTDADRQQLQDQTGMLDAWPVVTEPFTQWVLEDRFSSERPPVEELGVILTDDVEPYERMKLQLLNAGHSCLAYLAALAGHEFVHDAMADEAILGFLDAFFNLEAGPVVPPVPGIDLDDYKASLIERFSNPAVADQIARLCLDGSAKFPKFLLPTVRAQLADGGSVELSALALAGWCRYLQGVADDGSAITPSPDPLLDRAVELAGAAASDPAAFLGFDEVFGSDLATNERFVASFVEALDRLSNDGAVESISSALHDTAR